MPSIKKDKVYLIDSDTARYFFLTEHYYPAFTQDLSEHLDALREGLRREGMDRLPEPRDRPLPEAPGELPDVTRPRGSE